MTGCAGYTLAKGGQLSFKANGEKEKGMVHLTERRIWRTRQVHTTEYLGKMDFGHTLIRVNTIGINNEAVGGTDKY
jgi:hypothetical protein